MPQFVTNQYADLSVTNSKVASGIDAAKIANGSVSNTEFQYLDGVTSGIQDQIDAKLAKALNSANIFVGNGSNVAVGVAVSGEATINNTGAVTLDNDSVIDKVLTGFTSTTGTISSSDSILSAIEKLNGNVNALNSALVLIGSWDASAGTFPGGGTAQAGYVYIVSVAGTVDSISFAVGDRIVAIVDNASTTTFANNWFKEDYTDQVLSVFGRTGSVTAQSGDYNASQITSDAYSFITSANVQGALEQLANAIDNLPSSLNFKFNETPSGSIDGSNVTFTLANAPTNGSLVLERNGQGQIAGSGEDFTISGNTITMAVAPAVGEKLRAVLYTY